MIDNETTCECKKQQLIIQHWQTTATHYAEENGRLQSAYDALLIYRKWQWSVTIIEGIKCAAMCVAVYIAYKGIL